MPILHIVVFFEESKPGALNLIYFSESKGLRFDTYLRRIFRKIIAIFASWCNPKSSLFHLIEE